MRSIPKLSSAWRSFGGDDLTKVLVVLGLVGLIILVGITLSISRSTDASGSPVVLLMVAAAAFAFGGLIALVMTAFEDERQIFGSAAVAINGVIGGFTLADVSRNDGAIRTGLRALAAAAGLENVGLAGSVVAFFGALGFACMFFYRQYQQRPEQMYLRQTAEDQKNLQYLIQAIDEQDLADIVATGEIPGSAPLSNTDQKRVDDPQKDKKDSLATALEKFRGAIGNPELLQLLPFEMTGACAKACYLLGKFAEAERILSNAHCPAQRQADKFYLLSKALLAQGRHSDALKHLTFLSFDRSARLSTFKLLGYTALFVPGKLDEAEAASRKYHAVHPEDRGATLNLACALGQRGPQKSARRDDCLQILENLLQDDPSVAKTIRFLMSPGQDFYSWSNDQALLTLLARFESPPAPTLDPTPKTTNGEGTTGSLPQSAEGLSADR
jgi:tetratricopeptide (TPR) repeat protein